MLPKPSKITHNFHLTRCALQHGHLALNQKQNWLVSGAYLQRFRLERHRNHHLETSYQVHLLSSLVLILPALQPCWVQGKTHRTCCPVMCQKNRATHAAQAIKNNAQLPSDKMCPPAWTSSSQSEAELACIWCLSSDIQTGAAQKSSSWDFISSASSVKLGFNSTRLATMLGSRKNPQSVLPGHVPKESKIRHHFHLTRRAMWHGHLTLNQKQNWLYLVLIFRHSDWSGTEIIILRLHIKCIFCQARFQFYPPCNHVGFKEKPTERVARSCAKRIKNKAPLPSDKTCYVAWTSNAQSEAELALSGAYLQTFRLERHRNHHLETSYQVHLLSSLVLILPALQPCCVQGKTHRACCLVMCQKNRATHATQAIKLHTTSIWQDVLCSMDI